MTKIDPAYTAPLSPQLSAVFDPPVMEARRWVADKDFPAQKPLINLSQAAPSDAPPLALREAIAKAAIEDVDAHLYGPVLGHDALRAEIAAQWSTAYGAEITPDRVTVTSGCNQAFCAAISTLAAKGDAVLLPAPWYFNHKMWLEMQGIDTIPLPCDATTMLPDLEAARALLEQQAGRIKALVLVTPNNPTGAEYPATLLDAAFDLAAQNGAALIVDETYRDYDSRTGAPHRLFQRPEAQDSFIHLYSFSKVFRLTGHRVGAMICSPERLAQAEKFLDTVTICPSSLGQIAALEGLRQLQDWVANERLEVLARRAALERHFEPLANEGWKLVTCGAYFAWIEHPWAAPSNEVAKYLVDAAHLLMLPGTMFTPSDHKGGERALRMAFANADANGIATALGRLQGLTGPK